MKIPAPALILLCLFGLSCRSGEKASQHKEKLADTANYYPLAEFFRQQIEYVDLRDFHIYHLRIVDGRKDSMVLSKEQFIGMANSFLRNAFTEPGSKAFYKETVFEDLSTGSYTLNYTATDPSREVSSIDVLLNPNTNAVKRVFIKTHYNRGDTSIDEQAGWKADKSFQLIRKKQTANGYHSAETNYINWNDDQK